MDRYLISVPHMHGFNLNALKETMGGIMKSIYYAFNYYENSCFQSRGGKLSYTDYTLVSVCTGNCYILRLKTEALLTPHTYTH